MVAVAALVLIHVALDGLQAGRLSGVVARCSEAAASKLGGPLSSIVERCSTAVSTMLARASAKQTPNPRYEGASASARPRRQSDGAQPAAADAGANQPTASHTPQSAPPSEPTTIVLDDYTYEATNKKRDSLVGKPEMMQPSMASRRTLLDTMYMEMSSQCAKPNPGMRPRSHS